jgi:hypothetical protein
MNYECLEQVFTVEHVLLLVWIELIDLFCMVLSTDLQLEVHRLAIEVKFTSDYLEILDRFLPKLALLHLYG